MSIKLIAIDLDGTTLDSGNRLTEKTKAVLTKAASSGIEIVPVTGRCYQSLPKELLALDGGRCIRYVVTSNGAEIRTAGTGEILYKNYIHPLGVDAIKAILCKKDWMVEIYVKGSAYIEQAHFEKIAAGQISYRDTNYVLETRVPVKGVIQLLDVHKKTIEKVAVYFDSQRGIREEITDVECVHVTASGRNNVELIAENCSKAKTLEVLCGKLNLTFSQVMAIGDSYNDIEMLNAAAVSVAMGNAEAAVKKCADFITLSNDYDGMAEAIEQKIHNMVWFT